MTQTTLAYIAEGDLWGSVVVCLPSGERLQCHNLATARLERDKYNRAYADGLAREAVAKSPQRIDYAAVLRTGKRARLFRNRRTQS